MNAPPSDEYVAGYLAALDELQTRVLAIPDPDAAPGGDFDLVLGIIRDLELGRGGQQMTIGASGAEPVDLPAGTTIRPLHATGTSGRHVTRMPVAEFRALGYLQELNRLFLHPHGLAIEVNVEDDGTETFGGVWDYRDDPEGIIYGPGMIDRTRAVALRDTWYQRLRPRHDAVGFMIQPLDEPKV